MERRAAYDLDPTLRALDTVILASGEDLSGPWALLEDTVLYPEGGGQPSDQGTLGGATVRDVRKTDQGFRHVLSHPVAPGPVRVELDWGRRYDHMQQHSAQHLLTAVAQDRFGFATTAFHLGAAVSDIELEVPSLSTEALQRLEEAVAAEVRSARPIRWRWVTPEAYGQEAVRSRGLPEGHQGDIRLVDIEGLDLNTCGGTHVASTAELEVVKLLGTEPIRGGTRLFFVAGGRARRRFEAHERRNHALRTLLGASDEGLVEALQQKLDQLAAAERAGRRLEEALAEATVTALDAQDGLRLEAHLEGRDLPFLQSVARGLAALRTRRWIFLTSGEAFVLASGEASLGQVGREVAQLLEGKGGGAKGFFQGRVGSLRRRAEAVALLDA